MEVVETTVTLEAARPSKVTFAPGKNPVPVMVIAVPPKRVAEFTLIETTVGGLAMTVKVNVLEVLPAALVAVTV